MRIVHYLSEQHDHDLLADYVLTLQQALEGKASVEVFTKAHRQDLLAQPCPDILHLHTCWDYASARLARQMAKRGAAIVFSPHGELSAYTLRHEQPVTKRLRSLLYQRAMIRQADALLVSTEEEERDVLRLEWQKRIGVVGNPLLDRSTTLPAMAERLLRFYRKVIDSRYYTLMSRKEKDGVCLLLREGILNDRFSTPANQSERDLLCSLSEAQWRRMLLYADDEDIRTHVDRAIAKLRLDVPAIRTEAIDRFHTDHPKAEGLLAGTSNDSRLQRATDDSERTLRILCAMLLSAHQHTKAGTLSMNHLADLYTHLKYDDYDEDRLRELTRELGIYHFAQSIVRQLIDYLQLEEGFQPLKPRNGRMAKRLRGLLIH